MNKPTHTHRVDEDLLKKVEGHLDELKGTLLKATGHHVQGDKQILKGKMENHAADLDIAMHAFNEQVKHDVEKARQKVRSDFKHHSHA